MQVKNLMRSKKLGFLLIFAYILVLLTIPNMVSAANPPDLSTVDVTVPSKISIMRDSQGVIKTSDYLIKNNSDLDFKLDNFTCDETTDWKLAATPEEIAHDQKILYLAINDNAIKSGETNALNTPVNIDHKTEKKLDIVAKMGLFFTNPINNEKAFSLKSNYSLVPKTYDIIFNTDGGSNVANTKAKGGSIITFPKTTKSCFTLQGWTCSEEDTLITENTYKLPYICKSNQVTFTAQWEKNQIIATPHPYEGIVDGKEYTGSVTANVPDCTFRYGTSPENCNLTSPPTFSKKGRHVFYYEITKEDWFPAKGQVAVVLRNPNITSSSVIYEKGNGIFDVKGNGGSIQTTYGDKGYLTFVRYGDSVSQLTSKSQTLYDFAISRDTTATNEYGYVRTTYTITNNADTERTIRIGFGCDAELNGNDRVPCTVTDTGLTSSTGNYTFAYYTRNTDGVDDCDGLGVGEYPPYKSAATSNPIWNMMPIGTNSGSVDSGLGASWTRTIPAKETITISWGLDML